MGSKYLYSRDELTEEVERSLDRLDDEIELVDVSSWGFEERRDFYFREIMPISMQMDKDLTEHSSDQHAGFRDYEQGVLITDDSVYVSGEVVEHLRRE